MRYRTLILAGLALVGCVGDSTTPQPDGGGNDATTNDTGPGNDGSSTDGGSDACIVTPETPLGVDCFAGLRCTRQIEQCCFTLSGSGFVGQCEDASPTACAALQDVSWQCDKPSDCSGGNPVCCASTAAAQFLFSNLTPGCPFQIAVPDGGDAGPPQYIAQCTAAASCNGSQTLCAVNSDCPQSYHCVPVQFPTTNKVFGICVL